MHRTCADHPLCFPGKGHAMPWNHCSPSAAQALETKYLHKSCKEVYCKIKSQSKVPFGRRPSRRKWLLSLGVSAKGATVGLDWWLWSLCVMLFLWGFKKICLLLFGVSTALFHTTKRCLVCSIFRVTSVKRKKETRFLIHPQLLNLSLKLISLHFAFIKSYENACG